MDSFTEDVSLSLFSFVLIFSFHRINIQIDKQSEMICENNYHSQVERAKEEEESIWDGK